MGTWSCKVLGALQRQMNQAELVSTLELPVELIVKAVKIT